MTVKIPKEDLKEIKRLLKEGIKRIEQVLTKYPGEDKDQTP